MAILTARNDEPIPCPDCGAQVLTVVVDPGHVVLVNTMPALWGNVSARETRHGWHGYRVTPTTTAAPLHVVFAEHVCDGPP